MADDSILVTIKGDSTEFVVEVKKAQKANEDMEKSTKKMGLSVAESWSLVATGVNQALQIFNKVAGALRAPIEAFRESELAANELTQALENQGLNATEVSAKYREMASALQVKTGIDDDAIIKNLALLQSFVGQQEITEELAVTMLNLGTRTRSMEGAAEILGRAIQGNTRGLKQFNIDIDETGTRADRTSELIEKFGFRVGGAAVAANRGLGSFQGLQSAFSNLLETVGEQLAPGLSEIIIALTNLTRQLQATGALREFTKIIGLISVPIVDLINKIGLVIRGIELLKARFEASIPALRSFLGLGGGGAAAQPGAAPGAPAAPVKSDAERQAEIERKKAADQQETEAKAKDAALAEENLQFNKLILDQNAEFQTLDGTQRKLFLEQNEEALKKSFQSTQEAQQVAINTQLQTQITANNRFLAEQRKFGTAFATINQVLYSEQVQGAAKAAGELTALQKSNNATLKAIGKAAAVADITIKTAQSAMNIYLGFSTIPFVGPLLGIGGAAAAIAFGGEQIANVLAAQSGGIVPGLNRGMDSTPALLQPGELVVPRNSFSEVVSAVADRRAQQEGASASTSLSAGGFNGGNQFTARLEFSGDGAEKFLTARQVEARSLGTLVESAA